MINKYPTVRITRAAHTSLSKMSEETGEPMTEVMSKAIEFYRRQTFLDGLNKDFDKAFPKVAQLNREI